MSRQGVTARRPEDCPSPAFVLLLVRSEVLVAATVKGSWGGGGCWAAYFRQKFTDLSRDFAITRTMMETACTSETSAPFYQTTPRINSQDVFSKGFKYRT
jgi:hypothetical protein